MSYIPDCRTDETYNEKHLNEKNKEFVRGFDWCAEEAVDMLFDNLDCIENEDLVAFLERDLPDGPEGEYEWRSTFSGDTEKREILTFGDYLRSQIIDWIEMERNELITSMLDSQASEDELPTTDDQ